MIEGWREWLYPLGFLSSAAFGARALIQWIQSERAKKSLVTKRFWYLSLAGNILLMLHAFLQLQFHVCVVQACNSVVSWRNLNLMKPGHAKFLTVIWLLIAAVALPIGGFLLQGYLFYGGAVEWFRIPEVPWLVTTPQEVSAFWHLLGVTGIVLFTSRFWIQWWFAEKQAQSFLGPAFWWVSLAGALLSLFYFAQIKDPVNLIGPALGMIPYIRNLMIINKAKASLP